MSERRPALDARPVPISRRWVLAGMAGSVALAACGGGTAETTSAGGLTAVASGPPLATAEAEAWMTAAGSSFRSGAYVMQLTGVELMGAPGARPANLRQQAFIAVFDVVAGGTMPGDLLYTISHSNIPTFDIHLSAGATNPARMVAFFN